MFNYEYSLLINMKIGNFQRSVSSGRFYCDTQYYTSQLSRRLSLPWLPYDPPAGLEPLSHQRDGAVCALNRLCNVEYDL